MLLGVDVDRSGDDATDDVTLVVAGRDGRPASRRASTPPDRPAGGIDVGDLARTALGFVVVLVAWELLARTVLDGTNLIAPPTGIVVGDRRQLGPLPAGRCAPRCGRRPAASCGATSAAVALAALVALVPGDRADRAAGRARRLLPAARGDGPAAARRLRHRRRPAGHAGRAGRLLHDAGAACSSACAPCRSRGPTSSPATAAAGCTHADDGAGPGLRCRTCSPACRSPRRRRSSGRWSVSSPAPTAGIGLLTINSMRALQHRRPVGGGHDLGARVDGRLRDRRARSGGDSPLGQPALLMAPPPAGRRPTDGRRFVRARRRRRHHARHRARCCGSG